MTGSEVKREPHPNHTNALEFPRKYIPLISNRVSEIDVREREREIEKERVRKRERAMDIEERGREKGAR